MPHALRIRRIGTRLVTLDSETWKFWCTRGGCTRGGSEHKRERELPPYPLWWFCFRQGENKNWWVAPPITLPPVITVAKNAPSLAFREIESEDTAKAMLCAPP